jgi:hypothetical protein
VVVVAMIHVPTLTDMLLHCMGLPYVAIDLGLVPINDCSLRPEYLWQLTSGLVSINDCSLWAEYLWQLILDLVPVNGCSL